MSNYKVYQDLDFKVGDSGVIIDLDNDLGSGIYTVNLITGAGQINVELSYDGTTFGDPIPAFPRRNAELDGFRAKKIRLLHTGIDSGYILVAFPIGEKIDISQLSPIIALPSLSITSVTSNASTATLLLAANANRCGFIVSSKGVNDFWIRPEAASVNPTVKEGIFIDNSVIDPWGWPSDLGIYTGEVSVIAENASPVVHVVEF